jgi:arylsulfatase A-like enzyme
VVLVCALAAPGCDPAAEAPARASDAGRGPFHVLLVSIDTLRADHMSVYGYERATTPALETLAGQGVRFDAAYAPTSTTAPSHVSLFTSLYPPTHRVIKNGRVLAERHVTLAEVLTGWGYRCAAVVSSFVLNRKFNYDQGFESWNDDFSLARSPGGVTAWEGGRVEGKFYGRADDTTRRAIEWLEGRASEQPFFLFVHYYDPHDPYAPPAGWLERLGTDAQEARGLERAIARYDAEIAFVDSEVRRLFEALDELGLGADMLVVLVGDHGEGLMDHGHLNHGADIYEEAVRVPLIARLPGRIAAGSRVVAPVALIDVAPTILELVAEGGPASDKPSHHPSPDELLRDSEGAAGGRSLVELLGGEASSAERPVYFYRRHYEGAMVGRVWAEGEKFGVRDGRWKYTRGSGSKSEELYDLDADPAERNNLLDSRRDVAERLAEQLDVWLRSVSRPDSAEALLSEEDRARLEALGYVD